jgi:adhesin/invasin
MRHTAVRRPRRALLTAFLLSAVLGGLACSDKSEIGPGKVITVRVVPDTVRIVVGKSDTAHAFPLDAQGGVVAGKKVTWSIGDQSVATITPDGEITGLVIGSTEITAQVAGLSATAPVFVTPAPAIGLSDDSLVFTAVAQSGTPLSGTIDISNTGGASLDNLTLGTIAYSAGATGWVSASLDQPTAPTTLTVDANIQGLAIGTYTATIPVTEPTASNTPQEVTVVLSVTAGTATTMALQAGNNQIAAASATVATPPSVLVTDQFGNPVPGQAVTFAVQSGGGSVTGGAATSGTDGIAAVTAWQLGTTVGSNTLTATATGLAGSPFTFTATAVPAPASQIAINAGNGQSAIAGQAVTTPPSVLVRDQFGNAVGGVAVTFAVATGGGALIGTGAQTTNSSGIAAITGWTLGTTAGANTLTATATGLAGSPVTFTATGTPGPATTIAVSAGNGQSATAGTTVAVAPAARVTDANGNGVPGVTVTFVVASGGGQLTAPSPVTGATGIAAVGSWRLGPTVGANSLTATAAGLAGSPLTFTATGTTGPAAIIAVNAGNNQAANAGQAVPIAPSVKVTDINGNPVAGIAVTFAVASGGGSITGPNPTTDAQGVAAVGSWTLGTTAGSNTLTASSGTLTGSPVTFTATGNPGNASNLALSGGNGQTGTVGAALPTPISVLVTDNLANPVQGVTVSWAAANGGLVNCGAGNVASCSSATNASGIASATWVLGTAPGAQTATGAVGGLTGSPVTFNATANVGPATSIAISAGNNQNATVNTAVATAPAVRVADQFGNGVGGISVTFAIGLGAGQVTGANATTNGLGIATVGSWTLGTTAGTNTLTATSAGLTGSPITFSATGTAGAATQIAVNAGNNQSATVATTVPVPPSVIVRDQFNNPVQNVAVAFALGVGGGSITGANQNTGPTGVATLTSWTLGQTAGTNTITATSGGLNGSPATFTATGMAGAVTTIIVQAGAGQSATVNTAVATDPSVLARDQFLNPVPNVAITFTVTVGGGSVNCGAGNLTQCTVTTTNPGGIATVTSWTLGTTAGTNTLTATRTGATGTSFTATGTAGTVSFFSLNSTNNQTQRPGVAVASAPSVIARDAFSNPVPSVPITFTVFTGGGVVNCGAGNTTFCNVTTSAGGVATVSSWTLSNGGVASSGTYANSLVASRTGATSFTFNATGRWSLSLDVQPILTTSCAISGCHVLGSTSPRLDAAAMPTSVRGVASLVPGCGTLVVIGFNVSASSYLYQKLFPTPCSGVRMPATGSLLTTAQSNIIRDWIDNASPSN